MPKQLSLRNWTGRKKASPALEQDISNATGSSFFIRPEQEERTKEQEEYSSAANSAAQNTSALNEHGLTLLNPNSERDTTNYVVDVVAIHGLGGDAFKTWTHENGKLWLRDFLLDDLPGARIFTYGYDSGFAFSNETSTLRDYARTLLEDLRSKRRLAQVRNNRMTV